MPEYRIANRFSARTLTQNDIIKIKKGNEKMKKLYQKIIVSILSFAIMGTVCAFAPVMAEASETTTPATMYFDKKYQAFQSEELDIVAEKSDGVLVSALNVRADRCRQTELFGVSSANVPSSPKGYRFQNPEDYLVINLPAKDNYELKTVGVTTTQGVTGSYGTPFDYYYSTNGEDWVKVNNTAYTGSYLASAWVDYYGAFCEAIKVPSTATKLKVERNSKEYSTGGATKSDWFGWYPGVIGFEFAYIPKTNNDILTLEAKHNSDIISFLSSGMLPDGENKWTYMDTGNTLADGTTKEYGLTLTRGNYNSTLNAIDGYKITSFSAKFDNQDTDPARRIAITLGNKTVTPVAKAGKQDVSVTYEDGAEGITFKSPSSNPKGFTDIVITMEKIVVEDDTPVVLDRFDTDDEYQAWWTTKPSFDFVTTGDGVTSGSTYRNDTHQRNTGYFGTASSSPWAYHFTKADAAITIKIPEKKNYKPSAVEVTVGHKNSSYQMPFNYQYSTDNGVTWTNVANTTYTPGFVASAQAQYYYAFCEVVKVPENATHLKVVRNSNVITEGNGNSAKYPMVMGLEFGYKPVAMADVLTFSAKCDGEIISLLASGIFADGSCGFECTTGGMSYDYDNDGTPENGFLLKQNSSATINAVEGYKITSVTGKYYGGNSAGNKITVTLGDSSKELSGYVGEAVLPVVNFEINSKVGADSLTFADNSAFTARVLFDIVITMKKVGAVTPDGDTAMSAAIDGTKATATFTNLGSAKYETMVCILAAYNGERFMGTKMETVYKNDIDGTDMVTFDIPKGATRVKAFLWKDLETIAPVFNDIELAVPAAE